MKHDTPQFFPDDYGIGQSAVARIRLDMAQADMADAAPDAFSTAYINADWQAMQRRLFDAARADYERAKAVLQSLGEV